MIKKLSNIFGVSGFENDVRNFIKNELCEIDAQVSSDKMGNLFVKCIRNNDYPTVVLGAHMDEVGFIITDITSDGYLKFDVIGDINPSNLISKKVVIGNITGIIALKAIHLTTKEEREKPIKLSDLFIDIGAKSKEEAEEVVEIGDYCAFKSEATDFGTDSLKGKALKSRVGCGILIDILKNNSFPNINLICAFTVQNNVRARGVSVAVNEIGYPEYLIVIDGFSANSDADLSSGSGAALSYVPNDTEMSKRFFDSILCIANNNRISIQRKIADKNSDLYMYKSRRNDIASVGVGIPIKNINTPTEIIEKIDIKSCCDIIRAILLEVNNGKHL